LAKKGFLRLVEPGRGGDLRWGGGGGGNMIRFEKGCKGPLILEKKSIKSAKAGGTLLCRGVGGTNKKKGALPKGHGGACPFEKNPLVSHYLRPI